MNDRETSQVYSCAQCGFVGHAKSDWLRMLWLWLHHFTTHQHLEPELLPEHSKALLAGMMEYRREMIASPALS